MACERDATLHLAHLLNTHPAAFAVFVPCSIVHGDGPGSAAEVIERCMAFVASDDAHGWVNNSSLTYRDGQYGFNFWFTDPDTAFAFKMRFG